MQKYQYKTVKSDAEPASESSKRSKRATSQKTDGIIEIYQAAGNMASQRHATRSSLARPVIQRFPAERRSTESSSTAETPLATASATARVTSISDYIPIKSARRSSPELSGHPLEPHVRAKEAEHALTFKLWGKSHPADTPGEQEANVEEGTNVTVAGRAYKPAFGAPPVQPKLTISAPDDPYEREADRVAEQVMRMSAPGMQTIPTSHGKAGPSSREDDLEEALVQPKLLDSNNPSLVQEPIEEGGQALPGSMRAFFEPRFHAKLGHVRIHTDEKAKKSASAIGAQAYTVGSHIAFGEGRYSFESQPGKQLIAHELTHVLQQGAGAPRRIQRDVELTITTNDWTKWPVGVQELSDEELMREISLFKDKLLEHEVDSDEYRTAQENLHFLKVEQCRRDPTCLEPSEEDLETEEPLEAAQTWDAGPGYDERADRNLQEMLWEQYHEFILRMIEEENAPERID